MYDKGVFGAIVLMGEINNGKSDRDTQKMVKQIINAMTEKKRQQWPDKRLRKLANEMDDLSKGYFLNVLQDMSDALDEHFGGE